MKLAGFILDVRVDNAAGHVERNAGHREYVDADATKRKHPNDRLDDGLESSGDARRQRRVVRSAQKK